MSHSPVSGCFGHFHVFAVVENGAVTVKMCVPAGEAGAAGGQALSPSQGPQRAEVAFYFPQISD